jgi:hypothetical protein
MSLNVERVVGGCVSGEKSLLGPDVLETLHLAFSSSGRLMRILRSIVAPSTAFMTLCDSKMTSCCPVGALVICDELVWDKAIFLQKLAHQFKRRPLVASGLDQNVEHFALGIHGSPEVDQATIDLEIDLVEMPDGMRLRPAAAKIGRDLGSKVIGQSVRTYAAMSNSRFAVSISATSICSWFPAWRVVDNRRRMNGARCQ